MQVEKNELAGALVALGKLICRTSPVEAYKSIQIAGKENSLRFRTAGSEESIEFRMNTEVPVEFSVIVDFEAFRQAVRGGRNKSLVLEFADGVFSVDGLRMPNVNCEFPQVPEIPLEGSQTEKLPENFVELLNMAAPIVNRNDYRKALQGINLSRDGITATNGRELFNIPLQMGIASLTIPFPMALLATKASGESALAYWTDGINVLFEISAANWRWTAKAVAGVYPNWKLVIPEQNVLKRSATFTTECGEQLKSWLKTVPDDPPNNGVEVSRTGDMLTVRSFKGMENRIPAEFTGIWEESTLFVNRDILIRLLNEGHTRIECQDDRGPFLATGGVGQYVAMPLYNPNTKQENKPETNMEESKMNEENTNTVSAPVQTVAPIPQPVTQEPVNPLEDLTASIEAFKLKLKGIFDESNALSRKVREVVISQKQKERDFILAKRAIERIRMAI